MASTEVRRVENKMMVILEEHQEKEQQNISHNSFHSSFPRIRSEELNDMGYGLSKISPIIFDGDAFQTPSNRVQDNAPWQSENPKPYNAELSMAGNGTSKPSSRFIPLQPQPSSMDNSCQDTDNSSTTTAYYEKSTGGCQNRTTGLQMSPRDPRPTGTTTATQTSHKKTSQAGGTQTTPPPSPKKSTSTGGTQTSPLKDNSHEQVGQGHQIAIDTKKVNQLKIHQAKERKTRSWLLKLHLLLDHLHDHQ